MVGADWCTGTIGAFTPRLLVILEYVTSLLLLQRSVVSDCQPDGNNLVDAVPLLADGDSTDDALTDDDDTLATGAPTGQLAIRFSTTNEQVSSHMATRAQSGDAESTGNFILGAEALTL